jgi:hypothetical protein
MVRRRRLPVLALLLGLVLVALLGLSWVALQPRTANHFGYALAGADGLPAYLYLRDRRYYSAQVCAGDDWCEQDRLQLGIPRCWRQPDLASMNAWPVSKVGTLFTVVGASHDILSIPNGALNAPLIVADGPDCYVVYTLEGSP